MSPTAPPHVCFVAPYIESYLRPGSSSHVGGAERQQHLLAERLRDAGWTVSFIAFEGEGGRHERIDGFECWKTLPRTNDVRSTPRVLLSLFRTLRSVDADVFYVRGNPPLCILTSYCCSLLGHRLVYVVANDSNVELSRLAGHHSMFEYTLPKLGYLDAMRRADRIVAQTEHQQDVLEDVFGIDATVVPNGYTLPEAADVVPADAREYVLWVGSLDPDQKRPEKLLALADRLPAVPFRVVGWTGDDAYREELLDRMSARPNLTFEGFVPPDEIDRHYRGAVALVNTSAYEGFPNTFLEAWRYGVPVVSLEAVLDGVLERESVGVHVGSLDALERTVETLWNDRDRTARLGSRGRQYLEANYALDVVESAYVELFTDLIGSRPSREAVEPAPQ